MDWTTARRILCVRADGLGDLLMTTPALHALRQRARHLVLLTSRAGAACAPFLPDVDETLVYEAPWMKSAPARAGAEADRRFVAQLRARRFDAAVIFTVYSQSPLPAALLCYLADVPLRLAHCRENPYQILTDWVHETEPEQGVRHEAQRQLDLVASIGAAVADDRLRFVVTPSAQQAADRILADSGLDIARPWVLIHPGASAPSRRYPAPLFAEAASRLVGNGLQVAFSGLDAERELVEDVRVRMRAPSWSFAGRLDLGALAGMIRRAPLVISNNTGPAHLAAALGTPLVDLYALTNPQHTPWRVPSHVLNHDVPCRNCYRSVCPRGHNACLAGVPPAAVAEAALSLLAETQSADRRWA